MNSRSATQKHFCPGPRTLNAESKGEGTKQLRGRYRNNENVEGYSRKKRRWEFVPRSWRNVDGAITQSWGPTLNII